MSFPLLYLQIPWDDGAFPCCSLHTSLSIRAFSFLFYSLIISHFCQEDYTFSICKPIKEKFLPLHLFAIIIKATVISENKTTSKLYFFHFIYTFSFNCQQIYISIFPLLNGRAVTQNVSYSSYKKVSFRVGSATDHGSAVGLWNPSPLCTKVRVTKGCFLSMTGRYRTPLTNNFAQKLPIL